MVDRTDPARTGVKAGRIVGLLTAVLAAASLLQSQSAYAEAMSTILGFAGLEATAPVAVLFWGNVLIAAIARYTIGYVVGSLVGVVYDWLEKPGPVVMVAMVAVIGLVDGTLAVLDTRSVLFAAAYLFAWLCYVPVFFWLYDPDPTADREGPLRLGEL